MKQNRVFYFLILGAGMAFGLSSCGSSSNGNGEKSAEEFKNAENSLQSEIQEVVYNIPSPSEIPYMIQATGAEFNQALVNPRSKVDQYLTRSDKTALNLGVFATDIGYLSSYDKTQEAIDYVNSSKQLADNLGVIGPFDLGILKRFESNIGNQDSLVYLLDTSIQRTQDYLNNDNRNKTAALILTGSFIEGLYISTGLVNSYPKDILPEDSRNLILTPVIRVILQQKKSVSELTTMLGTLEQTDPVSSILNELKTLQGVYEELNIEEKIKNNRADLMLSDKNLVEISAIVKRVRNSITQ